MKVLVVGNGTSGQSVAEFLKKKDIEVVFATSKEIDEKQLSKEILDRLLSGLSFVVTSPGVKRNVCLLKEARKRKIKIIGEFEFGANLLSGKVVAVTGTNGKTTTVSIIHHLLQNHSSSVFLGGNIGVPVTSFAEKTQSQDVTVLEASSFQLSQTSKFRPNIAAILNLAEDHLNYHGTMKNYINSKFKITKNQTSNDFLLLNADDELLMQLLPKTKAQIFYFSTKRKVFGCYVKGDSIYFNDNLKTTKLVSLKRTKLVGEHNVSNMVCAVLAVWLLTQNVNHFQNLKTFQGIAHRIEFVKTINGVSFYNDSKATNPHSTIVATKSFSCGIHLILGGSDKGYLFDELFKAFPQNVKSIAVFGETKNKIVSSAKKFNFTNFQVCESLKTAIKICFEKAKSGEVVLLSPACASFDCFSNYKERGVCFKQIVKEFENEINLFKNSQGTEV